MDSLILPKVSEQAMSIFLWEVSDRHPDEFILMVMDGGDGMVTIHPSPPIKNKSFL